MASNIKQSERRFKEILKGAIRRDLKGFISNQKLIGRKGKDKVTIPLPYINLPRFRHGQGDGEGSGEGEGEEGQPIAPGEQEGDGEAGPKAGEGAGEHDVELDVSLEELAQILGEELELPRIEPKGKKTVYSEFEHFAGLRKVGPDALLRFQPSYLEALKRTLATGEYDPEDPNIIITKDDMRFRSWRTKQIPESDAVIFYLMDVSGSMSDRHKKIARLVSFWTDLWIRKHYKGMQSIYVVHDHEAQEVDEHTFYHTTTSGGTRIWSGYDLVNRIIDKRYNPAEWNIYLFQYSDGENWGDNKDEFNMLRDEILPKINLMCYGQIDIPWWSGSNYSSYFKDYDIMGPYLKDLMEFGENIDKKLADKIVATQITDEEDILTAIKAFLGTGK